MSDCLAFRYRGRTFLIRAIELEAAPGGLPRWVVDVEGELGRADTIEAAILAAARFCETRTIGGHS